MFTPNNNIKRLFVLFLSTLLLSACNFSLIEEESVEAHTLIDDFTQAVQSGRFAQAHTMLSLEAQPLISAEELEETQGDFQSIVELFSKEGVTASSTTTIPYLIRGKNETQVEVLFTIVQEEESLKVANIDPVK